MAEWLTTILSVVAGGALTMATSWFADQRLNERERERRREERRERIADRRAVSQRETLLSLQVASQKLLRNTSASLHQDILAHRAGGVWQKQKLPDGLSDENLRLMTETMLLASRVRDDDVRALADRLRSESVPVLMAKDQENAEALMRIASETQDALIVRIGRIVRELDEDELL